MSRPHQARIVLAVALLAAGMVAWAALPPGGTARPVQQMLLAAAACCAVFSVLRLAGARRAAATGLGQRTRDLYSWPGAQLWMQLRRFEATVPWAQLLILAVLGLEALHPARPWHTGALGLLLLAYLLALHLAETQAPAGVFRPQLPLLAAGLGLLVLSVAAAALPAGGSGWLAVLAAIAAVLVAGLALPV